MEQILLYIGTFDSTADTDLLPIVIFIYCIGQINSHVSQSYTEL